MATLEGSWSQIGKLNSYITVIHGTTGSFLIEPYREGRLLHATVDHPEGIPLDVPALAPEYADPTAHFLWDALPETAVSPALRSPDGSCKPNAFSMPEAKRLGSIGRLRLPVDSCELSGDCFPWI